MKQSQNRTYRSQKNLMKQNVKWFIATRNVDLAWLINRRLPPPLPLPILREELQLDHFKEKREHIIQVLVLSYWIKGFNTKTQVETLDYFCLWEFKTGWMVTGSPTSNLLKSLSGHWDLPVTAAGSCQLQQFSLHRIFASEESDNIPFINASFKPQFLLTNYHSRYPLYRLHLTNLIWK